MGSELWNEMLCNSPKWVSVCLSHTEQVPMYSAASLEQEKTLDSIPTALNPSHECMNVCALPCPCWCAGGGQRLTLVSSSLSILLFEKGRVSLWLWRLWIQLVGLASKPQGSSWLRISSAGLIFECHSRRLFTWVLEIRTHVLMLA